MGVSAEFCWAEKAISREDEERRNELGSGIGQVRPVEKEIIMTIIMPMELLRVACLHLDKILFSPTFFVGLPSSHHSTPSRI